VYIPTDRECTGNNGVGRFSGRNCLLFLFGCVHVAAIDLLSVVYCH
jgi:hypothetical protein